MNIRKRSMESLLERILELEPAFGKRKKVALLERHKCELFEQLKKELSENAMNILIEYCDVLRLITIEKESYFYECGMKDAGGIKAFLIAFILKSLR
ncbi:MAG TPA: hypothetical protein VF941_03970 [Clostridia bacterium]